MKYLFAITIFIFFPIFAMELTQKKELDQEDFQRKLVVALESKQDDLPKLLEELTIKQKKRSKSDNDMNNLALQIATEHLQKKENKTSWDPRKNPARIFQVGFGVGEIMWGVGSGVYNFGLFGLKDEDNTDEISLSSRFVNIFGDILLIVDGGYQIIQAFKNSENEDKYRNAVMMHALIKKQLHDKKKDETEITLAELEQNQENQLKEE